MRRLAPWLVAMTAIAGTVAALVRKPRIAVLLRRWLTAGALSARTALRAGTYVVRRAMMPADRRDESDVAFAIRSAEDVVETLGNMKGAFMKAGQLLSFVDDGMPEHVRGVLSQLQDSASGMSPELAAGVVRTELGAAPEKVFKRWDPEPVAAASIGQVHRAVMHDGRIVAVKVQYPGVADLVEADLAQLELGRFFAPAVWPNLNVREVSHELQARLREELDYEIEATNQRDFATWYADHPFIRVPAVVDELSTARVLTTSFEDGRRFAEFEKSSQSERDRAAETIFRFVFRSVQDHLAFNGDPHPGNYLFADDSVTFLDFGLVKRLSPEARETLIDSVRYAALDPDPRELRRVTESAGYFAPGNPLTDKEIFDFSSMLWSYLADDAMTTVTPESASRIVRSYLFKGPEYRHIDRWGGIPTDLVVLQRITVGLIAILGRLNASANWHRIAREIWFGEPPGSALGEREAEWMASISPIPR